jgi:hypothetical protein
LQLLILFNGIICNFLTGFFSVRPVFRGAVPKGGIQCQTARKMRLKEKKCNFLKNIHDFFLRDEKISIFAAKNCPNYARMNGI